MNGLELIRAALRRWRAGEGASASTYGLCQKFEGWYVSRAYDPTDRVQAYATALKAYKASPTYRVSGVNDRRIQPGDSLYFAYGTPGHICTAVGWDRRGRTPRLLVSQTAHGGDTVLQLSNNVKITHADTITLRFLGVSHQNGTNLRRTSITPYILGGAPAGGDAEPVYPPAKNLEDPMAAYTRAKGDNRVFEISTGRKFHVSKNAWKAITKAFAAAGAKVPYSKNVLTKAELEQIPNG